MTLIALLNLPKKRDPSLWVPSQGLVLENEGIFFFLWGLRVSAINIWPVKSFETVDVHYSNKINPT